MPTYIVEVDVRAEKAHHPEEASDESSRDIRKYITASTPHDAQIKALIKALGQLYSEL